MTLKVRVLAFSARRYSPVMAVVVVDGVGVFIYLARTQLRLSKDFSVL